MKIKGGKYINISKFKTKSFGNDSKPLKHDEEEQQQDVFIAKKHPYKIFQNVSYLSSLSLGFYTLVPSKQKYLNYIKSQKNDKKKDVLKNFKLSLCEDKDKNKFKFCAKLLILPILASVLGYALNHKIYFCKEKNETKKEALSKQLELDKKILNRYSPIIFLLMPCALMKLVPDNKNILLRYGLAFLFSFLSTIMLQTMQSIYMNKTLNEYKE